MDDITKESIELIKNDSQDLLAHLESIKQATKENQLLQAIEKIRENEIENLRILEEIQNEKS